MAANWTGIENALQAFVVASTGYPGARVVWAEQNGKRPPVPFADLRIDNDGGPGGLDELRIADAPDPQPGADLVLSTHKLAEFVLTVQVFGVEATGDNSPRAILTRLKNRLSLESSVEAFVAVNVAVIDQGVVHNLTGLLENEFEPRALLAIRMRVADGAEELNTWIETAEVSTEIED